MPMVGCIEVLLPAQLNLHKASPPQSIKSCLYPCYLLADLRQMAQLRHESGPHAGPLWRQTIHRL